MCVAHNRTRVTFAPFEINKLSSPPGRFPDETFFIRQRLRELTLIQVMCPDSLDKCRCFLQRLLNWGFAVRVYNANLETQILSDTPNGACKVRVIGNDDCLLIHALEAVNEKSRYEIYV